MSYQVLARKWRPKNFPEMVGQVHVLRALVNALDNNRLHHAYLFTGTRGVGKTSVARILAKSLNCLEGLGSNPCGVCSACREIDEGRFVDLIEVDAASKTKVEDTRELLENVQYAPTSGRYKVYLIDEVHMLSTHSFNALLKTLEEPPEHVKFLLATTDPQKLPATVLSRCLQFNLKCLPIDQIVEHQSNILKKEGIEFEKNALIQIARAADGSMRDSLSLLDQAIAFGGGELLEAEVQAMLGTIAQHHVYELIGYVFANKAEILLSKIAEIASFAPNYSDILADIINVLHRISLAQIVPQAIDDALGDKERIETLAQKVAAADLQLYYQIALMGRKDLPHAPEQRIGFEMVMLRMLAFGPATGEPVSIRDQTVSVNPVMSKENLAEAPKLNCQETTQKQSLNNSSVNETSGSLQQQADIPQQNIAPKQACAQEQAVSAVGLTGIQAARAAMRGNAGNQPLSQKVEKKKLQPDIKLQPDVKLQNGLKLEKAKQQKTDQSIASEYMQYADMQTNEPVDVVEIDVSSKDNGAASGSSLDQMAPQVSSLLTAASQQQSAAGVKYIDVDISAKPEIKSISVAETTPKREIQHPVDNITSPVAVAVTTGVKWNDILSQLSVSGITSQLAANCSVIRQTKDELVLKLEDAFVNLLNPTTKEKLGAAINQYFGVPVRLQIDLGKNEQDTPAVIAKKEKINQQKVAEQVIENDPIVASMKSIFGAQIQPDSIQPI